MIRAAIYARVSTLEQNPQAQLLDLQQLAQQRGLEIVETYLDHGISGTRVRRPALDKLMKDASRHHFDLVMIWSFDRLGRSVKHLLETLDEFNHLGIQFLSFRENIDSSGPLGRALLTIISAVAELERNLIVERVRAGMRRARLEGRRLGRPPSPVDHAAIIKERAQGHTLSQIARSHAISRALVCKVLKQDGHKGLSHSASQSVVTAQPEKPS